MPKSTLTRQRPHPRPGITSHSHTMTPQNWHDTDRGHPERGCAIIAFGTLCFWGVVAVMAALYFAGWWRINQIHYFERQNPTMKP